MKKIFIDSCNIVSALGNGVDVNFDMLLKGISGVQLHDDNRIDANPARASLVNAETEIINPDNNQFFSKYETLLISAISGAQKDSEINISEDATLFVFSSTKGNISLMENQSVTEELIERMSLFHSAKLVTQYFKNNNQPVVISNACISGVAALIYAKRIIEAGEFKNVVVCGADTISKFVYSGFQSFQALSPGICHPFSENRDGINLGEASAAMILTSAPVAAKAVFINEGGISNDSNHISGPSRTGEELSAVINKALSASGLTAADIDFISAHGTATPYNDEMEAKAFHLSGLKHTPVNSLKGYFGHTLGAAGLLESAICVKSLQEGVAVSSYGYTEPGVVPVINVLKQPFYKKMKHCLKTASGFGGCNAAIIFSRN